MNIIKITIHVTCVIFALCVSGSSIDMRYTGPIQSEWVVCLYLSLISAFVYPQNMGCNKLKYQTYLEVPEISGWSVRTHSEINCFTTELRQLHRLATSLWRRDAALLHSLCRYLHNNIWVSVIDVRLMCDNTAISVG